MAMLTEKIKRVLTDPAASFWLKDAIEKNLKRDPVDAANDAEVLCDLLEERCHLVLAIAMDHDPGRFKDRFKERLV
jgi:hypothetical protein